MKFLLAILDGASYGKTFSIASRTFSGLSINAISTIYPSVTFAAHTSIITGTRPHTHKVLANRFIANNSFIDFDITDINHFVSTQTLFERYNGKGAAIGIPLYRGANTVVTMKEIAKVNLFERNKFVYEKIRDVAETHDVVVANFLQIDNCGELYGPNSDEYLSAINEALVLLKEIIDYYKPHFLITADHGMVPVEKRIPIDEIAERNGGIAVSSHRFVVFYKTGEWLNQLPVKLIRDKERIANMGLPLEYTGEAIGFADGPIEFMVPNLKGSHGGDTSMEMTVPLITDIPIVEGMIRNVNEIINVLFSTILR